MNPTATRRRLLTAALCLALPLGGVACNGMMDESELALNEATAFLTVTDESGPIGRDAVASATPESLSAMAEEEANTATEAPTDAAAVCDFSARRQEVLGRYDTNSNGKLDGEEMRRMRGDFGMGGGMRAGMEPGGMSPGMRLPMRGERGARHMAFGRVRWAFDENGDGTLSTEERAALVDALEARCQRLYQQALERFDANGDGQLDETERQAARDAARAAHEARRQELLTRYDANGNGVLDFTERQQFRADRRAAMEARRQEVLARFDTNGDGRLSPEEALPLRREIQARIINGEDLRP